MTSGVMHLNLATLIDNAIRDNADSMPFYETPGPDGKPEDRREYIGASWLGTECERAAWYTFRWWQRDNFHPRIRRRFETGHIMEDRVVRWLEMAGFEVRTTNPSAKNPKGQYRGELFGGLVSGHVDGFIRHSELMPSWGLLEIKAMVSAKYDQDEGEPCANRTELKEYKSGGSSLEGTWWKLRREGVRKVKPEYYAQMQVYMGMSTEKTRDGSRFIGQAWGCDGPLNRGLFIAVNTDTDQIYDELVEFNPKWYHALKARAIRIARGDEPPDRKSESPDGYPCQWCDYRDTCHGTEPAHQNCRTCKHSELKVPGDDGWWSTAPGWLCSIHKRNCSSYVPCDQWTQITNTEEMF